jgi:hypothetical protein
MTDVPDPINNTMKRPGLIFLLLLLAICVNAQKELKIKKESKKSIFEKIGSTNQGIFFRFEEAYTQLNNEDLWMGGGSVGMAINQNFSVGLSGRGWNVRQRMLNPKVMDTAGVYLEGGYGGLLLEYNVSPESLVKVTFSLLVGPGGTAVLINKKDSNEDQNRDKISLNLLESDAFFAIEPGGHIQLNIFKFMRLNAGISYRYVGNLQLLNTPGNLMNNFTTTIGLEFGRS